MGTINLASPLPGSQLIQRLRETIRPLDAKPLSATPVRPRLKVLAVASEIYPLVKTGGLADVTGALPKALSTFRIDTHSLVPGYPPLLGMARRSPPLVEFDNLLGTRKRALERPLRELEGIRREKNLPVDGQLFELAPVGSDADGWDNVRELGA